MTGEPMEGAVGRRAPFTQVGDWVALASISMQAKTIYWMLSAHVKRRDRAVWPSRESLAEWCGFGQARSVDRYLAELVDLGAIEISRRRTADGMRTRNSYLVHEYPPDDYTGMRSFDGYYRARAQPPAADVTAVGPDAVQADAPEPGNDRGAPQRTTPRPARTRKPAGQPVVRSSAPRSAPQRTPVVRCGAPELEEELQEKKTKKTRVRANDDRQQSDPLAGRPALRGLAAALREAGCRAGWPSDPARLDEITMLVARHEVDDLVAAAVQQDANAARTPGRTPAEYVSAYVRRWRSLPVLPSPRPSSPPRGEFAPIPAADPVEALVRSTAAREAARQRIANARSRVTA